MENGHNINTSMADGLQMVPFEQREHATSSHDIMARRLKNRERQRRYRARKRQEEDMKKACVVSLSTHRQVETQVNGIPNDSVSGIHCQRDWKKDARRAHTFTEQQAVSNCPAIPNSTPASGSLPLSLPSELNAPLELPTEIHLRGSLIVDNTEAHLSVPSGRNWKAEARNKKN